MKFQVGDWVFYDDDVYKILAVTNDTATINPVESGGDVFASDVSIGELELLSDDEEREWIEYLVWRWF